MKFSKEDAISYVAVLVIVVSLASIGIQFTGYATTDDSATVNVTITTSAAINFTVDLVDFGTGSVNNGSAGATLATGANLSEADGTWTGTKSALTLENIGNVNVTLNLSANAAAQAYLGGTDPLFQYKVTDNETDACGGVAGTYANFTTGDGVLVCSPLDFDNDRDKINIDIKLYIPSDSNVGTQTATITATGTYDA